MTTPILTSDGKLSFDHTDKAIRSKADAAFYERITKRLIKQTVGKDENLQQLINQHRSPQGYQSWSDHITLSWLLAQYLPDSSMANDSNRSAMAMSAVIAFVANEAGGPPRYLDPQLAESFLQTDLPKLDAADAPELPLPAMRLFFPNGLLTTEIGYPIDSVVVIDRELIRRTFLHYSKQGAGLDLTTLPASAPGFCILAMPMTGETYFKDYRWDEQQFAVDDEDKDIRAVIERATAFCAHTILTMVHKPELVTTGPAVPAPSGRGFKDATAPSPAAPVWIGRGYQPRRSRGGSKSGQGGMARRPHWRRGHWRHTACGTGRLERRLRWIRPVYVNPSEA